MILTKISSSIKIPLLSFLNALKKFKCSKFSTPSMTALITLKLKVSCLFSLYDEKLISIPLVIILRAKKICERFFTGPFNRNPFQLCRVRVYIFDWNFTIDIIFNLLY